MQWRASTTDERSRPRAPGVASSGEARRAENAGLAGAQAFTDQNSSYLSVQFGRPGTVRVPVQQGFGTNRYADMVLAALAGGTLVGVLAGVIDPTSLTGVLAIVHGLVLPVFVILVSRKAETTAPSKPRYVAQADTWTDDG